MAKKRYKKAVKSAVKPAKDKNVREESGQIAEQVTDTKGIKIAPEVWYGAIVFAAAFLLFARTIPFGMVYCDDDTMIVQDYEFNKDLSNITTAFEKSFFDSEDLYYRPILRLTFIMDANIGGKDPSVYRFTNAAIHAVSSLLFFIFLLKLKYGRNTALLISLFFVVHPLISPAVTWISGRNDTLLTMFMLLSFITYIIYHEERRKNQRSIYLLIHLVSFVIALFTKEAAASLPLMIILYIKLFRKEKFLTSNNIKMLVLWGLLGITWFLIRQSVLTGRGELDQMVEFFSNALASNYPTVPAVIGKIFLPVRMSGLSNFEAVSIISGLAGITAITALTFINKKTDKGRILFGALWFLLFISPTLIARIKDFDFDYAEHRVYLPLMGMLIIIIEILRANKINFKKTASVAAAGTITAVFAVITLFYQGYFTDAHAFWGRFIELYPDKTRGYIGVGKQAFIHDSMDKVIDIMKRGIEVKPDYRFWYANLSSAYIRKNDYKLAEKYAYAALQLDSLHPEANYNYAISLMANGKIDRAVVQFEKALAVKPDNPNLLLRYGEALTLKGRYSEAEMVLTEAARLAPQSPEVFVKLGNLYQVLNRPEEAEQAFARASQLNPNNVKMFLNLGTKHAQKNEYEQAEKLWLKAYSINPKMPEVLVNLTMLYHMKGDIQKAEKFGSEALENGGKLPPQILQALGISSGQ